jgi:toxin ParE1/3/4
MVSYRLNDEALADLDRLYEHGILTFGLRQADEYYDGIIAQFQAIAYQPALYPAVDHVRQGYRRSVYGSHSIYYRIDPDEIVIVRILGQQNIDDVFLDDE